MTTDRLGAVELPFDHEKARALLDAGNGMRRSELGDVRRKLFEDLPILIADRRSDRL